MAEIMKVLPLQVDDNLLVGFETKDDAAVYKLEDDLAIIFTADYITPVIDDPYSFGQVAAANAMSDTYAMGGRPLLALNLCNFPPKGVEKKVLEEIVRGGADKVAEAGALVVGGHTVKDEELKYGLAVVGLVHPDLVVKNSTAKVGDKLILTKPIGTGVMITGYKKRITPEEAMARATASMAQLNNVACQAMMDVGVSACTDITGFGFAGHALGLAEASGVSLKIHMGAIPYFPESLELIRAGLKTGATEPNRALVLNRVEPRGIAPEEEMLLYDPQTSGGLLISVPAEKADGLLLRLKARGITSASIIGEVIGDLPSRMIVE